MDAVNSPLENSNSSKKECPRENGKCYLSFNSTNKARNQLRLVLGITLQVLNLTKMVLDCLLRGLALTNFSNHRIVRIFVEMNSDDHHLPPHRAHASNVPTAWCHCPSRKPNTSLWSGPATTTAKSSKAAATARAVPSSGCVHWTNENSAVDRGGCPDGILWREAQVLAGHPCPFSREAEPTGVSVVVACTCAVAASPGRPRRQGGKPEREDPGALCRWPSDHMTAMSVGKTTPGAAAPSGHGACGRREVL